jgi:hypothetical protein
MFLSALKRILTKNADIEFTLLDQLARYEQAGVKLVLVTNLEKGKDAEIWGIWELDN